MSEEFNFEQAFMRLEEILNHMNSTAVTLDESLKLYEEAVLLIDLSTKRLKRAEEKIEMLIKKRDGELEMDLQGKIAMQPFSP